MKKLLLLILVLFATMGINAQDIVDPPKIFRKDTLTILDNRSNSFLLGWNWGGTGRLLDQALQFQTYHGMPYGSGYVDTIITNYGDTIGVWRPTSFSNVIADSVKAIPAMFEINTTYPLLARNDDVLFNGISLFLEPTLTVISGDDFKPRWNDRTGGIFGFRYRNFTNGIGDTISSGNDFSRYRLHAANVTNPVVVLDSIWDGSIIRYWDYAGTNHEFDSLGFYHSSSMINDPLDRAVFHPFNGKQFYLSVNLRALFRDSVDFHLNDTILAIELPYVLKNITNPNIPVYTTGTIKFDSIPDTNTTLNNRIVGTQNNDYRGLYRSLKGDLTQPTAMYITGKMLKVNTLNLDSNSITLSCFFRNVGDTLFNGNFINNPRFHFDWWTDPLGILKYIDTINVRVTYYGKLDVGIDYMKLETPRARKVFYGVYDTSIHRSLDTTIKWMRNNSRHPLLYRIYAADEFIPCQYGVNRYCNMLLDTIMTSEVQMENSVPHFFHATGIKEFWTGNTVGFGNYQSVPYIRYGNDSTRPQTFNYLFGFKGELGPITARPLNDTINSNYETFLFCNDPTKSRIPIIDQFIHDTINWMSPNYFWQWSVQYYHEQNLWSNFYKRNMLFNEKPWWANMWVFEDWKYDTVSQFNSLILSRGSIRPRTGEELRLMLNTVINLGCKGLYYYLKGSNNILYPPATVRTIGFIPFWYNQWGIENLSGALSGKQLIYSNILGADYILYEDIGASLGDYNYFGLRTNPSKYDFNTMGIDSNHIYTGIRSNRIEVNRIHKWIKAVEPDLLKLRLAYWYGRGFVKMISQDSRFTDPYILGKYIDTSLIRTKKLNSSNFEGSPEYGFKDSSFYDITLFRDKDDSLMTGGTIYLSLLNRRTDPLFRYHWNPNCDTCWVMKFLSTAEFEDSCGISPDPSRYPRGADSLIRINNWRSFWWARQGSREFRIPFHVRNNPKANQYTILKITELGAHDSLLNTQPWHRTPYMQIIDTTLAADSTLIVKLLPGEGKIFKIQIFYTDTLKGILDFTNQRKLVAYPIKQTSIDRFGENDSVRYHLVFHKPYMADRMKVYYKRSYPMIRGNDFNQINWEPGEYEIADSIYLGNLPNENGWANGWLNCEYPSIVVRYDTLAQIPKVYIVYAFNYLNFGNWTDYYIGENIFPANDPVVNVGIANAIYHGHGKNLDIWGTPVINGSYPGNYYAFADSLDGIIAGWKTSFALNFANMNTHTMKVRWDYDPGYHPRHPSLNSYSRIRLHEDNCALVFEDSVKCIIGSDGICYPVSYPDYRIEYTRLRMVNDTIRNYLPNYFFNYGFPPVSLDGPGNIANIDSWRGNGIGNYSHTLPVVYRGVEDGIFSQPNDSLDLLRTHWDIVYWQLNDQYWFDGTLLGMRTINMMDTIVNNVVQPAGWWVYPQYWIESFIGGNQYPLSHPNLSQGTVLNRQGNWNPMEILSDSSVVLNFKQSLSDTSLNPTPRNNVGYIWQMPHGYLSLYPPNNNGGIVDTTLEYLPRAKKLIFHGKDPQLAALPYVRWNTDWNYGRRVFNTNDEMPPSMIASIEYFARKTVEDEETANVFLGFANRTGKQMFTPLWLSDINGRMAQPVVHSFKKVGDRFIPSDTIISSWFKVGNLNTTHFFTSGNANLNTILQIERQSDGKKVMLPNAVIPGNKILKNRFILINGGNHKYRFKWIKVDSTAQYTESVIIANMPLVDELDNAFDSSRFGKTIAYENQEVIDLGEQSYDDQGTKHLKLIVYPNPADNLLNVIAYYPVSEILENRKANRLLIIKAYSSTGSELFRQEIKPGENISIKTDNFSQGIYFIRAEEKAIGSYEKLLAPVIETVIIER